MQYNISESHKSEKLLGLAVVLAPVLAYHLVFFNRFFPIQEGWLSVIASQMLSGKMPYRDFHLFLQPLCPLEITAIIRLFGDNFIFLRLFGLVERLVLVAVCYLILARLFPVRHAVMATLAAVAVYASHTTDIIYSYYQTCVLLELTAAYLVMIAITKVEHDKSYLMIAAAGLLSSLGFLTKQSTGLFVSFAILAFLMLFLFCCARRRLRSWPIFFCAAYAIPLIAVFLWLNSHNAFHDYLSQVYLGASSSKGSLFQVLFGFYERAFRIRYVLPFAILFSLAILMVRLASRLNPSASTANNAPENRQVLLFIAIAAFISFLLPNLDHRLFNSIYQAVDFFHVKISLVHYSFFFVALTMIYCVFRLLKNTIDNRGLQFALVATVSFALMYAHGLSYIIEEHAVIPALGLLLGILFMVKTPYLRLKNLCLYAFCFFVITLCAAQKYTAPYQWWGWAEPDIGASTETSSLPQLAAMRLSPLTNSVLTDITAIIKADTRPNDAIYTFPHIPVFHLLAGRRPCTFAFVHYFDVCPDYCALGDARSLLHDPPKAIVYFDFPESAWKFHEEAFRKGKPSGQRQLASAVNQLVGSGDYILAGTWPSPEPGYQIKLWVKNPKNQLSTSPDNGKNKPK